MSKQICQWFHFTALVIVIYPESGSAILPVALVLSLARKIMLRLTSTTLIGSMVYYKMVVFVLSLPSSVLLQGQLASASPIFFRLSAVDA